MLVGALHMTPVVSGDPEGSLPPLTYPKALQREGGRDCTSKKPGEQDAWQHTVSLLAVGIETSPRRVGGGQVGGTEFKTPQLRPAPAARSKAKRQREGGKKGFITHSQ